MRDSAVAAAATGWPAYLPVAQVGNWNAVDSSPLAGSRPSGRPAKTDIAQAVEDSGRRFEDTAAHTDQAAERIALARFAFAVEPACSGFRGRGRSLLSHHCESRFD